MKHKFIPDNSCYKITDRVVKLVRIMITFHSLLLFTLYVATSAVLEGDDCVLIEGGAGKCGDIRRCEHARRLLRLNQIPQQCGFKGRTPLVCCPISYNRINSKRRSQDKCEEYFNPRNQRTGVAHGQRALSKEFPHMASVGFENRGKVQWLCGGSLISEKFILTAAHCIKSRNNEMETPKWIRLGDLDLNSTTDDAAPEDILIKNIFVHPDYKPPSHYNDIALVELVKNVKFGLYIRPACLHTDHKVPNMLQAIGWGKTDFLGDTSNHLMKVTLNVISHRNCALRYSTVSRRHLLNGILDQKQICAGHETGKDTCPGDSGGPLHFLDDNKDSKLVAHFVIAGITSFGKGCGFEHSVGVYTRVSAYISWIEDIVWPSN